MSRPTFRFFGKLPGDDSPRFYEAPGARQVDIADGLVCFIYSHPAIKGHVVAEVVSGKRIGHGVSEALAIKDARETVARYGVARTIEIVMEGYNVRG